MQLKYAASTLRNSVSTAVVSCLLLGASAFSQTQQATRADKAAKAPATMEQKAKLSAQFARLPLAFEQNVGQSDPQVKYLSRGAGYTLFLTQDEAVLALAAGKNSADVVRVKLAGASGGAHINALERLGWDNNYFIGNDRKKWRTHVANYRKVKFENVYPGIELVYYGNQQQLEHDFIVSPGADPKKIALEIASAKEMVVDERGNLVIKTRSGELRFQKPVLYQDVNGSRKEVAGNFVLRGKSKVGFEVAEYDRSKALVIDPVLNYSTYLGGVTSTQTNAIALDASLNAYVTGNTTDVSFPPATATVCATCGTVVTIANGFVAKLNPTGTGLVYNTFFGGNNPTQGSAIALDGSNDAFVVGLTNATNFPATLNSFQAADPNGVAQQGFLIELNPTGTSLLYGTYLGGTGGSATSVLGLAVTGGKAYVTGSTSDVNFPVTATSAFQTALSGTSDAFLLVINPAGAMAADLTYSTFLGGLSTESGNGIAATNAANIYLAGATSSSNFPVSAGAPQTVLGGLQDAFVAKFDTTASLVLSGPLAATCAAGVITLTTTAPHSFVIGEAVVVSGVATGVGGTNFGSSSTVVKLLTGSVGTIVRYNVPVAGQCTPGPDSSTGGGTVFGGIVYSTYLGGIGNESANSIAVDAAGNAYVTGTTDSVNFPVVPVANLIQPLGLAGGIDAFVTKLNAAGTSFTYSTYLGGNSQDQGNAIVVDPATGTAWVSGFTASANFPMKNPLQALFGGGIFDGFVARINAVGNALDYSTYLGGGGNDQVNGMALDSTAPGIVYVTGLTSSTNFPTTPTAFQTAPPATNSAFVAKLSGSTTSLATPLSIVAAAPVGDPIGVSPQTGGVVFANSTTYNFTIKNTDALNTASSVHFDLTFPGGATPKLKAGIVTPSAGGTCTSGSGGVSCDFGTLAKAATAGDTATVAISVTATQAGGCFTSPPAITPNCTATTIVSAGKVAAAEAGSAASTTVTSNVKPVTSLLASLVGQGNASVTNDKLVEQRDIALNYIASVKNLGVNTATGISVTFNPVPAFFTLASSTPAGCTQLGGAGTTVTCNNIIASLAGGVTTTVTITSTVLPAPLAASVASAPLTGAVATLATTSIIDIMPANEISNTDVVTQERDTALTATLTDGGAPVPTGGAITFTATVKNGTAGANSNATNVQLNTAIAATLPAVGVPVPTGAFFATCTVPVANAFNCGGTGTTVTAGTSASVAVSTTAPATLIQPVVIDSSPGGASRNAAGLVTITVTGGHLFTTGQLVEIARVTSVGGTEFNGKFTVTATTATTFSYSQAAALGADTGGAGTAFTPGSKVIDAGPTGAKRNANVVTITTSAAVPNNFAGFAIGQTVQIAGVADASFNGRFAICSLPTANCIAPTATSFTYQQAAANATSGGGTATILMSSQVFHSTASLNTNPAGSSINTPTFPVVVDANTEVQNQTDLAVGATFTGSVATTPLAGPFTYTLALNNTGAIAPNVTAAFTLTTGTAINTDAVVTGFTLANSCIANLSGGTTQTIRCLIDSLPTGPSSLTLTIKPPVTSTISTGTTNSDTLTTSATVSSDFIVDTVPGNETTDGLVGRAAALITTIQRQADIDIKTPTFNATSSAATGSVTGVTITTNVTGAMKLNFGLNNNGPDTALNVGVLLTNASGAIAAGISGISASGGTVCSLVSGNLKCNVPSVPTAGTTNVAVTFTPPLLTSMTGGAAVATDNFTTTATVPNTTASSSYADLQNATADKTNLQTVTTNIQRTSDVDIATPTFNATRSSSVLANTPGVPTGTSVTTNLTSPMRLNFGLTNNGPDTALNVNALLSNVVSGTASLASSPTGASRSANVVTLTTTAPHGFTVGQTVSVTGVDPIGSATIAAAPTGASRTSNVVTITTTAAHNFATGQLVIVDSVTDPGFNGRFVITVTGANTFTYNQTAPNTTSGGGLAGVTFDGPFTIVSTPSPTTFTYAQNAPNDTGGGGTASSLAPVSSAISAISVISGPVGTLCSLIAGNLSCSVPTLAPGPNPIVVQFTPPIAATMTLAGGANRSSILATRAALQGSASYVDTVAGNNTNGTTVNTNVVRQSDLQLNFGGATFTGVPAMVDLKGQITYTYNINNTGPDPAVKIHSRLTLSTGAVTAPFAFIAAGSTYDIGGGATPLTASGTNGCSPSSSTLLDCEVDGPVPVGISPGFVVKVRPPLTSAMNAGASSDAMITSAQLVSANVFDDGPGGNAGANNTSPTTIGTTIERIADLAINSMTATPFTGVPAASGPNFVVTRDATIHYDLVNQNNGPSDAINVVLTVNVPAGSPSAVLPGACGGGSGYNLGTHIITCNIPSLTVAAGATVITFVVTPPALAANTASTVLAATSSINSSSVVDNIGTNNSGSASITQERDVNLSIPTMTATPFTSAPAASGPNFVVQRDATIHYVLGLSNAGASDAIATLTVNIAAGSTLNTPIPAGCALGGSIITCNLTLAAGATPSLTLIVTPPVLAANTASTILPATATLSMAAGNAAINSSTNTGNSASVTQERDVNLQITTMTSTPNVSGLGKPFVVTKDSTISYALALLNTGPSDATNVVLTVNVAAGSAVPSLPGACLGGSGFAGNTITCNIGTILNGATPSVTFVVTPPALAANTASTVLPATAALTTNPVSANNTSTNSGNSVATTQERDINLQITTMTSTPNVSGLGKPFVEQKDATINYTVTVQNSGPSDATNVVLTINVFAGSTLPAPPAGCALVGNTITCTIGTLAVGVPQTLNFVVTPPALPANIASRILPAVAALTTNPVSANNTSTNSGNSVSTTQERDVNLSIPTMTATPFTSAPAASGPNFVVTRDATISYVLGLSNTGPSSATNVVLTLNVAAGSTLNTALPGGLCLAGSGFAGNTITCNIGTMASGATLSLTFSVTPPALAATTASTILPATASVSMSPASSANNASANSSNSASVTQERDADLAISMAVPPTTLDVGPGFDTTSNGHQQATYTLTATNNGPSDATHVIVTDVLPTGFNFTSAATVSGAVPTCTGSGAGPITVTCDFTTNVIPSAQTAVFTITATATQTSLAAAQASGVISNQASIASADVNDPSAGNNLSAPTFVTLHGEAHLSIGTITGTPVLNGTLFAGDDVNFVIPVSNAGPHPSQLNLNFANTLPAGTVPVSFNSSAGTTTCTLGATTTCTLVAGISVGGVENITIRAHVPPGAVTSTGTATTTLGDSANVHTPANPVVDGENLAANIPSQTNNGSINAKPAADMQLNPTQTANPDPTLFGVATTFSINVTNGAIPAYTANNPVIGGSPATSVVVTNVVTMNPGAPAITISGVSNTLGPVCPAAPVTTVAGSATIICNAGTVASGATGTITFKTTPAVSGVLKNVATVSAAEFDPTPGAADTASLIDVVDNTPACGSGSCAAVTPVIPLPNANAGQSPLTLPQAATTTFTTVTQQGTTSILLNAPSATPLPYRAGNYVSGTGSPGPFFYDIATTAVFSGNINVCINVTGLTFKKPERVRLIEIGGGAVTDITSAPGLSGNNICGVTTTLGRFAVVEPSNTNPVSAGSAALSASGSGKGLTGTSVDLDANATFDVDQDPCFAGIGAPSCSDKGSSTNSQFPDQLTYAFCSTAFADGVPISTLGPNNVALNGNCPGLAHVFTAASNPSKQLTVSVNGSGNVSIYLIAVDQAGAGGLAPASGGLPTDSRVKLFSVNLTGGTPVGGGGGTPPGGTSGPQTVSAGQAATFTASIAYTGVVTSFTFQVTPAISDPAAQILCTANPNTLAPPTPNPAQVTVVCNTQGPIFAMSAPPQRGTNSSPMLAGIFGITALPLVGMVLLPGRKRRIRIMKIWSCIGLLLLLATFQLACGSPGGFGGAPKLQRAGTPKGVYTIMMTANPAGSITPNPIQLGCVLSATVTSCTGQVSVTVQ